MRSVIQRLMLQLAETQAGELDMNRMRKWKHIFWVVRAAVLDIYKHYLMYPIFGNLSHFGDSSNLKKLSVALWHFMYFLGKDYTLKINRLVDVSLYPFYICACVRSLIVRLNLSPLFFNKVIPERIFRIYLIFCLFSCIIVIIWWYSHYRKQGGRRQSVKL